MTDAFERALRGAYRAALPCYGTLARYALTDCAACALASSCLDDQRPDAGDRLDVAVSIATYALAMPEATVAPAWVDDVFTRKPVEPVLDDVSDEELAHVFGLRTVTPRPTKPAAAAVANSPHTVVSPGGLHPTPFLSQRHGMLTSDAANVVKASDLKTSGEFQMRAENVPWPVEFIMETGRDQRPKGKREDRDQRHQIDWFRTGSYVEAMPDLDAFANDGQLNPYTRAKGTAASIAYETFHAMRNLGTGVATFEEVLSLMESRFPSWFTGKPSTVSYNRNAVRDTLRDCALFGILRRYRTKANKLVFVLP